MATATAVLAKARRSGKSVLLSFLRFLRRPHLDAAEDSSSVSRPLLLVWLLVFAFLATAIFALLALPLLLISDVTIGENLRRVSNQSVLPLLIALIVLGPLLEEMIFRGWLTGTYQGMFGAALFLGIFYGAAFVVKGSGDETMHVAVQIGASAAALLIFTMIERLGTPARPRLYKTLFPYLFWLQGLVFGGLHFANLVGSTFAVPLLMTAPLVICGWLFGYVRMVAGFGSAWLLHALYNLPSAVGAVLLSRL